MAVCRCRWIESYVGETSRDAGADALPAAVAGTNSRSYLNVGKDARVSRAGVTGIVYRAGASVQRLAQYRRCTSLLLFPRHQYPPLPSASSVDVGRFIPDVTERDIQRDNRARAKETERRAFELNYFHFRARRARLFVPLRYSSDAASNWAEGWLPHLNRRINRRGCMRVPRLTASTRPAERSFRSVGVNLLSEKLRKLCRYRNSLSFVLSTRLPVFRFFADFFYTSSLSVSSLFSIFFPPFRGFPIFFGCWIFDLNVWFKYSETIIRIHACIHAWRDIVKI